jgi:hypothetical protein
MIAAKLLEAPGVVRLLTRLPWPWNQEILASLSLVEGCVRPFVAARAWRWASGLSAGRRLPGLVRMLGNHGRFAAKEGLLAAGGRAALLARVRFEGLEHLDRACAAGGVLLFGFHLGPPVGPLALRARGYRPRVWTGTGVDPLRLSAWSTCLEPGEDPFVRQPAGGAVASLSHVVKLLRERELVFVAVDGKGKSAFEIVTQARTVPVRTGCLALRRHARPASLPLTTRLERGRVVVTVHAALPAVDPDPERDLALCREALTPLVSDYAMRYPDQCRPMSF